MNLPLEPQGVRGIQSGADASDKAASQASVEEGGAAFRALLDKLQLSAERLRDSDVQDADGLAGAVEDARSTLTDALSLQEQLLEAYRQRMQQGVVQ